VNRVKTFFVLFFVLFFAYTLRLRAQTSYNQGEELFMHNKPQEALRYLETAVSEDPAHVQAYLYLGIAYLQVNRVDDAIETYRRILPRGGTETSRIAFNLGNAYFTKGSYGLAFQYYSQALDADPSYASAYLNRANSRVKLGELADAVTDYDTYLSLAPGSPKRRQIERLVSFIRDEFAAAESRRLMAEEAARAEAERRRRLLEEITESLQAAAGDSTGLSAGAENVYDYDGEFELD
jgi:tetratricopeptide (TPR) repeat protein